MHSVYMKKVFEEHTKELAAAASRAGDFHDQVLTVVKLMREAVASGNKVLVAGNGGSAAEAQHFSDEMLGRYRADRPSMPAVALTADTAAITCIGNDYGYDQIFSRQIEGLGNEGDIFIGLTTSGNSANILAAAEAAKKKGMKTIGFSGPKGKLREIVDVSVESPSEKAAVMQEFHLHAIHLIFEAFEPEYKEKLDEL